MVITIFMWTWSPPTPSLPDPAPPSNQRFMQTSMKRTLKAGKRGGATKVLCPPLQLQGTNLRLNPIQHIAKSKLGIFPISGGAGPDNKSEENIKHKHAIKKYQTTKQRNINDKMKSSFGNIFKNIISCIIISYTGWPPRPPHCILRGWVPISCWSKLFGSHHHLGSETIVSILQTFILLQY